MTQHVLRGALSAMILALSLPVEAQPPQHMPRIGYIAARPADREQSLLPVLLHGLRELGYTEEKTLSSSGDMRRQDSMASSATWRQSWSASRSTSLW